MEGEAKLVEQFETKEEAQKTVKEKLQAKKEKSGSMAFYLIAAILILGGISCGVYIIAHSMNQPEPELAAADPNRTPVLAVSVGEDLIKQSINLIDKDDIRPAPTVASGNVYSRKNGETPGLLEIMKPFLEKYRKEGGKVDYAVISIKIIKDDGFQGIHFGELYHENWKDIDLDTLKKELGINNIIIYNCLTDNLAFMSRKILGGTK